MVTEPVIMKGAGRCAERPARAGPSSSPIPFDVLGFDAAADFDAAARIYRRCRAVGITPRGMVDCMIAAVAWRHRASLLAQDVDLQRVGQIVGIELDQASQPT